MIDSKIYRTNLKNFQKKQKFFSLIIGEKKI